MSVLSVTPRPVVLLPVGWETAEILVLIMTVSEPLAVIDVLTGPPNVIIAIVRVIDAVARADVSRTAYKCCCRKQRSVQKNRRNASVFQHRQITSAML